MANEPPCAILDKNYKIVGYDYSYCNPMACSTLCHNPPKMNPIFGLEFNNQSLFHQVEELKKKIEKLTKQLEFYEKNYGPIQYEVI